jgi:hypothetical protein
MGHANFANKTMVRSMIQGIENSSSLKRRRPASTSLSLSMRGSFAWRGLVEHIFTVDDAAFVATEPALEGVL